MNLATYDSSTLPWGTVRCHIRKPVGLFFLPDERGGRVVRPCPHSSTCVTLTKGRYSHGTIRNVVCIVRRFVGID